MCENKDHTEIDNAIEIGLIETGDDESLQTVLETCTLTRLQRDRAPKVKLSEVNPFATKKFNKCTYNSRSSKITENGKQGQEIVYDKRDSLKIKSKADNIVVTSRFEEYKKRYDSNDSLKSNDIITGEILNTHNKTEHKDISSNTIKEVDVDIQLDQSVKSVLTIPNALETTEVKQNPSTVTVFGERRAPKRKKKSEIQSKHYNVRNSITEYKDKHTNLYGEKERTFKKRQREQSNQDNVNNSIAATGHRTKKTAIIFGEKRSISKRKRLLEIKFNQNNAASPFVPVKRSIVKQETDAKSQQFTAKSTTSVSEVICGVCGWQGKEVNWTKHLFQQHEYMAWKSGELSLDVNNDHEVQNHLKQLLQKVSTLTCKKCGNQKKCAKAFMIHRKTCSNGDLIESTNLKNSLKESRVTTQDSSKEPDVSLMSKEIKCGVCGWEGDEETWLEHNFIDHEYLAWNLNEPPLDVNNTNAVLDHLKKVLKRLSKLTCKKCGIERKYVKLYYNHWKLCGNADLGDYSFTRGKAEEKTDIGKNESESVELVSKRRRKSSFNENENISLIQLKQTDKLVKCGRCGEQVHGFKWHDHLIQHNYMAWIEGEHPADQEDTTQVRLHMERYITEYKGLTCKFCEAVLTTFLGYQYHIRRCEQKSGDMSGIVIKRYSRKPTVVWPTSQRPTTDPVKCAVCAEEMPKKRWAHHLESVHYNLAWFEGGVPFDIMDYHSCYLILNDLLKKLKKLVCILCGLSRISGAGFYSHIIVCGKEPEEVEAMKMECTVCARRCLPLALPAHMLTHRVNNTIKASKESDVSIDTSTELGRRRAAVAAKANIEKITNELVKKKYTCNCGYVSYTEHDIKSHSCAGGVSSIASEDFSSDEGSGRPAHWESESDDSDSDVDSEVSAKEDDHSDSEDTASIPDENKKKDSKSISFERTQYKPGTDFTTIRSSEYKQFIENFCASHFTKSQLFLKLQCNEFEPVLAEELARYMPPLSRSCQMFRQKSSGDQLKWRTYELFEVQVDSDGLTFFVGGSVSAFSFVAPEDRLSCEPTPHYLSLSCQQDLALEGLALTEHPSHAGLIQIWSFSNFEKRESPQFVLGIAHDYGTVWSIDWCPSGCWHSARDAPLHGTRLRRMGLMAAACSNGSVYVFVVCHPEQLPQNEKPVYRTKPVIELQLCSGGRGRSKQQATCVHWSLQNGHSVVIVGYGDGTVAFFDITTESPILRREEDSVVIINPYYDSHLTDSTVTSLRVYPSSENREELCLGVWSVKTGAFASRVGLSAAPVLHQRFLVSGIPFVPFWPELLLHDRDIGLGMETSWIRPRLSRASGEVPSAYCLHSRRFAAASSSSQILLIRNMHSGSDSIRKNIIGTLEMAPLQPNSREKTNVGPMHTYNDAAQNFGLLFSLERRLLESVSVEFPLNGVTAIAFSPCRCHFNRLAWGGVAGFVHITKL